jgi:NADPH-ferrihemoprotein reductase
MIGPGTGIAPMRALIQERNFQANKLSTSTTNILYFGCRNRNVDYIYRDELEKYLSSGVLTKLLLAFSRENTEKTYVQHLISRDDNASSLLDMLNQGAYFYICGGTAMGHDVHKAIVHLLEESMSPTAAAALMEKLQESGRYVQELWSA